MDKETIIIKQKEIIHLAKTFCDEYLDEDYAELSEKLICKLGRKHTVPFVTGKTAIWAAAVIHALGTINFLFDKSFEPYVSTGVVNDFFGTKQATVGNKSKQIRDLLKLGHWDAEFSTKHMKKSNPYKDLMKSFGFILKKF